MPSDGFNRANPRKSNVAINVAAVATFAAVSIAIVPEDGLLGGLWILAYSIVFWFAMGELAAQLDAVGWLP